MPRRERYYATPLLSTSIPPLKDMSAIEVIRHRRAFRVINQARRNIFNSDYDLAERGNLELLNVERTSRWEKARCNVFLSSIKIKIERSEKVSAADSC
jgi:hypothetical protein